MALDAVDRFILSTKLAECLSATSTTAISRKSTELTSTMATQEVATALSKELRRRGFRFVGPTTMYALMQSGGMVDDHIAGCWRA